MPADTNDILYNQMRRNEGVVAQLLARIDYLERELAEIKTVLRQPKGAVTRASPDGTVAIRDPDIIAQQQRTGTRGYIPYSDPA